MLTLANKRMSGYFAVSHSFELRLSDVTILFVLTGRFDGAATMMFLL